MKSLKKFVALTLSVVILSSCFLITPTNADKITSPTIEAYEEQLRENAKKQKEYQAELDRLAANKADALEEKAAIDKVLEATAIQILTIEKLIDELTNQLAELDAKEAELLEEMESRRQAFLDRIAAMQEEGNVSYVELILEADSINDFLTRLDHVNSMLEYDKKVIADLKVAKKELENTREEKKNSLEVQKTALKTLEEQNEEFEALRVIQEENIAKINSDSNYVSQMKSEADKREDEFNQLIMDATAEIIRQNELNKQNPDNQPQPPVSTGQFMWPLTTGYISSHFGYRDFPTNNDYHGATDIAASTGTPIYASASGTVIRSEWHDSYGYYVLIDHGFDKNGNNITTLYAHMSVKIAVAGRTVNQGDIIGQVGNTGYSFGSHLHFEYRINGQRVDPELYVPR